MRVLRLFAKAGPQRALVEVEALSFRLDGIEGMRVDSPLRHALLLPRSTLDRLSIGPGALRENILVDEEIHHLPSGTVLASGALKLRLTFHCEPCAKTRPYARSDELEHRRGYLAQVVAPGVLRVGDQLSTGEVEYAGVPYPFAARVEWFLSTVDGEIPASALLREIGVHRSYARALPRVLAKLPPALGAKVTFQSKAE